AKSGKSSVSIIAPAPFNIEKIEQIIESKRSWIYRSLAEWEDLNRTRIHRDYVNGESFLYFGRNYRLQVVINQDEPLVFQQGQFRLIKDEIKNAPEHFKAFYKTKLQKKLQSRLKQYQSKMKEQPSEIRVMELQNRWGSCTSKGVINFHWKCAMLPLSVLDYVIVHELAHLENKNHSPVFWRTVEKVMPNYEEAKTWLKFNGAGMSL
ncbi:M48 family metallopeptidase, partial [Moritella viscosa]|uniref:M48 family metallopeptidase n=1 Tax=Moritella viscosa TaxID=80854 RepID=UPI00094C9099